MLNSVSVVVLTAFFSVLINETVWGEVPQPTTAVPMHSVDDLQAAQRPSLYQGIQRETVGAVYFPDTVLSYEVPRQTVTDNVVSQWSKAYRFVVVPFTIGVRPNGGRVPKSVSVFLALPNIGQPTRQAIVLDVFPATRFEPSSLKGSVTVGITGDAKFRVGPTAAVGSGAKAAVTYTYSPFYAKVLSTKASGHASWQFSGGQRSHPVGDLAMKLILAVPRSYKEKVMLATLDVEVVFPRYIVRDDTVVARFETEIQLPEQLGTEQDE